MSVLNNRATSDNVEGRNLGASFRLLHVRQGEFEISSDPNVVLTTILGSCVAACIWDPSTGIGGMNHMLLPGGAEAKKDTLFHGTNAMEVLINSLLRAGAVHQNMRVKLLGGATMYQGVFDVGIRNAEFAEWFVENEGLQLVDKCLGGSQGRNVRFWPATGMVQRKLMGEAKIEEPTPAPAPAVDAADGEVELF